jgi:hypothetical protein
MRIGVRTRLWLLSFTLVMAVAACEAATPSGQPTQAESALAKLVADAQAGNFTAMCDMGDGNCQRTLNDVGVANVHAKAPVVVGSRVIEASGNSLGGRVLEVCGTNGSDGRTYLSEILAFRDGVNVRVINPIYWSGIRIASGDRTAPSPNPNPITFTCTGQ